MNPDDEDLDRLLAETAAVRARLRVEDAGEQPPAHLDDAILAASRRAVSARPVPLGGSGFRRWRMPLAAAAVVVLATSVALLTLQEGEHERVLESAPPALPASEGQLERRQSESKTAGSGESAQVSAEQRVYERRADEARRDTRLKAMTERERDIGPASGQTMERAEPSAPAAPVASTAPAADATMAAGPAPERVAGQAAAPPVVAEKSPRPAAKAESAPPPAHIRSPVQARPDVQANAVAKRRSAEALQDRAEPVGAPERELQSIRNQWERGDRAGARAALAAFLRAHPEYVLPADFPVPRPAPAVPQEKPAEDR
jgi:hypothetical protein